MKKVEKLWLSFDTLDDKVFMLTVMVSIVVGVIALVAGALQHLPFVSMIATFVIVVFMALLLVLGIRFPQKRALLRLLLLLGINFVLFPVTFIFSGGIHSGMILFFLIGLFLVAVMLRGKAGEIVFIISLLIMILSIEFAQHFPELVSQMSLQKHYQDVKVTLILSGIGLYAITVLIFNAYNQERHNNRVLMEKLQNLSIRDTLSGLYNRGELYRRLEIMYGGTEQEHRKNTLVRERHYIAMLDIDDFKLLNDTYGHDFGDRVLAEVSHVLDEMARPGEGEIAARYGGEEFVCVLVADNMEEAYARLEESRKRIGELTWERDPALRVHISGGVVSCMSDDDLTGTMRAADELLYKAKRSGKDRICRQVKMGSGSPDKR